MTIIRLILFLIGITLIYPSYVYYRVPMNELGQVGLFIVDFSPLAILFTALWGLWLLLLSFIFPHIIRK